jgi:hypothetical protein
MLPVSLDCQFLIASTVFFVVEFCFACPRLMSNNLETLATWETKDIRQGQTKQIPQQRKL